MLLWFYLMMANTNGQDILYAQCLKCYVHSENKAGVVYEN
jgi:hypothetical protein